MVALLVGSMVVMKAVSMAAWWADERASTTVVSMVALSAEKKVELLDF